MSSLPTEGKICPRCKLLKSSDCFYKRGDSLHSYCKACKSEQHRTPEYRAAQKARDEARKSRDPDAYRQRRTEVVREWRRRNREKQRAHCAVYAKRRRGTLIQQPCEDCGSPDSVAHHEDYNKRVEVTWLCVTCHSIRHRNDIPSDAIDKTSWVTTKEVMDILGISNSSVAYAAVMGTIASVKLHNRRVYSLESVLNYKVRPGFGKPKGE